MPDLKENQPIWICDTYAGFFHEYTGDGMARVGAAVNRAPRGGTIGVQAVIPVEWIKEREVR